MFYIEILDVLNWIFLCVFLCVCVCEFVCIFVVGKCISVSICIVAVRIYSNTYLFKRTSNSICL